MWRGIGTRKKKHCGDEEETWDEEKKNISILIYY